ncbi:MAG: hypothetical protein R6X15_02885 [Pseudomonadota bacterium]
MPHGTVAFFPLLTLLLCLFAPIATAAEDGAAQPNSETERLQPRDADLRVLEIRVDAYTFDDVIGAYQYQDVILLPLGGLAYILDLAIDVGTEVADGFVISEKNTFYLDTSRQEIILNGKTAGYPPELVQVYDGEIYVESALLGKWLGMTFDIDLYGSRVWVRSERKLPFLARIEREQRIAKSLANLNQKREQFPRHHESYQNYDPPFIDQTLSLGRRYSDTGDDTSVRSTTHATADLLQHESNWYLTMNDEDEVDEFRLTLGRTDPEGRLLGPLGAGEYRFGHVSEPRIGLVTLPAELEYGAVVSSYPVGLQSEYDRHRFTGELLPGWEVELYRNNALIGYQQTPVNGQYDFQDVPLLFGSNHFRLVFYGPRGEIREQEQRFDVSQSLTPQGQHYYRASVTADENERERATVQYDYGLTRNLSSSFNYISLPLEEDDNVVRHNYLAAGLTGFWDGLRLSAMLLDDDSSGDAVELDLQTRIDSTTIGFTDIYLNDFVSEEYSTESRPISRSSKITLNTAIPAYLSPRIPVTLGYKRDELSDGGEVTEISNQLSMSVRGFAMTNTLRRQMITDLPETTNGDFRLSTHIRNVRLRSSLAYTLEPESEVTYVALTMNPGKYGDYHLSFGLNHSLRDDLSEYSIRASKLTGRYGLSIGGSYNTDDEINLSLDLSFGLGYEPRRERWQSDAGRVAGHGSVSVRFFVDANQDGIYNEGDEPITGAGVRVNGAYSRQRSDADGILFLTGIPAYNPTDIAIAPETLEDPLWRMVLDGVQVVPRPGHTIQVDFPVFMSGEIDGTVYLKKGDREMGVGDVTVELVDKNGRVITRTKTAYDGFYILTQAPLGDYRVRIGKNQLDRMDLSASAEESVTVNADYPYVSGVDFTLAPTVSE